jgi:hypothetical protein
LFFAYSVRRICTYRTVHHCVIAVILFLLLNWLDACCLVLSVSQRFSRMNECVGVQVITYVFIWIIIVLYKSNQFFLCRISVVWLYLIYIGLVAIIIIIMLYGHGLFKCACCMIYYCYKRTHRSHEHEYYYVWCI